MNTAQRKFGEPDEFIKRKVRPVMDSVMQEFIAHSSFVVLATSNATGDCDASPKGGQPGFTKVLDEKTLLIPDIAGNRLFNSYENIESNPKAALIFMIPGCGLTVRVNGRARVVYNDEKEFGGMASKFSTRMTMRNYCRASCSTSMRRIRIVRELSSSRSYGMGRSLSGTGW